MQHIQIQTFGRMTLQGVVSVTQLSKTILLSKISQVFNWNFDSMGGNFI